MQKDLRRDTKWDAEKTRGRGGRYDVKNNTFFIT